MATLTIKNIPDDHYERLKQRAEANRRSLNSEVIICIEQAVSSQKIEPEQLLARARQLREKTSTYQVSDIDFTEADQAGRK